MNEQIKCKVIKIINENLEEPIEEREFIEELELQSIGINSITIIKIIVGVEEEFGIEFEDEKLQLDSINTFGKLIAYIESKIQ